MTFVGSPSGRTYVEFQTIGVKSNSSKQYSISELEDSAKRVGKSILPHDGDTSVTAYAFNAGGRTMRIQHISFNSQTGIFQNQSVCNPIIRSGVAIINNPGNDFINNFHTSLFNNNYPSYLYIHNPEAVT